MKLKDRILKEIARFIKRYLAPDTPDPEPQVDPTPVPEPEKPEEKDMQDPRDIKLHSFGSPNVGKARYNTDCQIKDFKMDKNGMSYKWVKGGCEALGAKDKTDAGMTLAVCGYSTNGIDFHVCKFDWISTSRTTRSWENVKEHYNGINSDLFFNAPKRCFFICDRNGSYRTNILTD